MHKRHKPVPGTWAWTDYTPTGIKEMQAKFRPVFQEVLPQNSKRSFEFHFMHYFDRFVNNEIKETMVEELERFRNYLIHIYHLEE